MEDVTNIHLPEEGEDAEETKKMVEAEGAKYITLGLDLSFDPLVSAFRSSCMLCVEAGWRSPTRKKAVEKHIGECK